MGPSWSAVAGINGRGRAAPLALVLLGLVGAPAWAQGSASGTDTAMARYAIDAAPQTMRACKAIAALAGRGARALRAADLLGREAQIDLRNDGHPARIARTEQGTAHMPLLVDGEGNAVAYGSRSDYPGDAGRLAPEIAVLRVDGRVWEVAWAAWEPDGAAYLQAATDGTAVCRFHVAFLPPVFRMLPGGERAAAGIYRALLLGHGRPPPSAGLDAAAVEAASGLNRPDTGSTYTVQRPSWRVDLLNDGRPMALARVEFLSSAGSGCFRDMLGLVQDGRVAKVDLFALYGAGWGSENDVVPLSRSLRQLVRPLSCVRLAETPVLGRDGRAYVLLDNTDGGRRDAAGRVRLLVGARRGTMQPLARLFWPTRNEVDPPRRP